MSKKPKLMVLDTETTLNRRRVFNAAYQITSHKGFKLEERDFWIQESLDTDAPFYPCTKPETAKKVKGRQFINQLREDLEKVETVFAYNSPFDKAVIEDTFGYTIPKPMKDLWSMSAVYICDEEYIKWARENGKVTPKGNIKTSAETVYQYISGVDDIPMEHTAAQDVQMEKEILKHLLTKRPDFSEFENHNAPWRIVKKRAEEMDARNEKQV